MFVWGVLLNQNLIFTTMARLQLDSLNFRWLETCRTTQFGRENPSSLKLTYAPGKWLVGRWDFLLGSWPIFRGDMGDMLVSRRENSTTLLLFCYVGAHHATWEARGPPCGIAIVWILRRFPMPGNATSDMAFESIDKSIRCCTSTCCTWTYWLCYITSMLEWFTWRRIFSEMIQHSEQHHQSLHI